MSNKKPRFLARALLLLTLVSWGLGEETDPTFAAINGAQSVIRGEVTKFTAQAQTKSMPPRTMGVLSIGKVEALRGTATDTVEVRYAYTEGQGWSPTAGDKVLVATNTRKAGAASQVSVVYLAPADTDNEDLVKSALSVPVGWRMVDEKPESPFAAVAGWKWPEATLQGKPGGMAACAKTGRPAFGVPESVSVVVEPVLPAKVLPMANPRGDGEFSVKLTNTTDAEVEVRAVLVSGNDGSDAAKILWEQSLVVIQNGEARLLPKVAPLPREVSYLKLKPKQQVSTRVNTLAIRGIAWPRGGSEVVMVVGLGDRAVEASFYYLAKHHDPIRGSALKP